MMFSSTMELCTVDVVGALTRIFVFAAVESMKFKCPLPPLVVSMPTEQSSNRSAWPVMWTALTTLMPVATSILC